MQPVFPPSHPLMPPIFNAEQLITAELPAREAIVEPILAREGLAMLYGPRGLGKTFVALGLAWAAAAGGSFLKWQASRPHRVLYVDSEMPAADMGQRLHMLGSAPPGLAFMMASLSPAGLLDLGKPEGQRGFERCWGETPPELLVLDNLSSLVGLRGGDPDSWHTLQAWLLGLRRRGMAVLMVHHAGKDGTQRGTSRREDVLDLVLALRRPADYAPDQGARFELHFEKARGLHGDAVAPFEARLVTDGNGLARFQWGPLTATDFDRAVPLFQSGASVREAAAALSLSKSACHRLRVRAVEMGLVAG